MVMVILVGIPCAGKDTWLNGPHSNLGNYYHYSPDAELERLALRDGITYQKAWEAYNEWVYTDYEDSMKEEIKNITDRHVVINKTNLTKTSRARYLNLMPNINKVAVVFRTPVDIALARSRERQQRPPLYKHVPPAVIEKMVERLEIPTYDEGFETIFDYNGSQLIQHQRPVKRMHKENA